MRGKNFHILIISAGLVLSLAPFVLFPVCNSLKADGSHMACWYSAVFITSMGILILATSFIKTFPVMLSAIRIVAAVLCWLIPNRIISTGLFGLCANPEHACRRITMPSVGIIVIVIVMLCISELIFDFVKGKK